MEFNKRLNVVIDVDEVLTHISPIWINLLGKNYDYFSKYMNIPKLFSMKHDYYKVLLRPNFYLEKSYATDYLNNIKGTDEENEFKNNLLNVINHDSFYTSLCKPTKMFYTLKTLINSSYFENVHIVSRCLSNNKQGKLDFLKKNLGKDLYKNIDIHLLDLHESKSEYINSIGNVDVIYEDELSNIIDIMKNCPINKDRGTDIYVPLHGYNIPNSEIFDLSEKTNYNVIYYEAIPGFNASTYMNYYDGDK